ncbi:transcriptional regulator [Agaricicola taiwanensis]|uniref:Transcriptional regulator n=1 Tax=Agaricicola taiwanensis TaxID=591372 RepID=A0A8J2YKW3_9RHOB|nr:LysR substrate-binding domain-containing protein [Agaricicola taiwanensis]GGE51360.1 transcriptional regulator [Agaricicola taiwanensis]
MRRNIPSTTALIAFEAAGRHESFSRAAEELVLTEGAVSRQIGRLEEFLGVPLFTRVKNRVHLTEAGKRYWERIVQRLDDLEGDTIHLQGRPATGGVIELAVIPTFANQWLIPRLPRFHARYPDTIINISERPDPFLFAGSSFDAALHYDHPAWAGMIQKALFAEELIPVCSPRITGGREGLDPSEIKGLPLLQKRGRPDAWKKWWDHVGMTEVNSRVGTRYDMFSMVIKAAVAGLGLALVPKLYVLNELRSGELIIACDRHVPGDKRYCIVYPERKHEQWPLNVFLDWLNDEAVQYVRLRDANQMEYFAA